LLEVEEKADKDFSVIIYIKIIISSLSMAVDSKMYVYVLSISSAMKTT